MNFNRNNPNMNNPNMNNPNMNNPNKNISSKGNTFKLNIFYKIPEFAGSNGGPNKDGYYNYIELKEVGDYQFINVGDKIQYNNLKHPNHLKKGIVRKYNRRAEFEIIFNDPPFLYEKDSKTGTRYKTNKKIKIIENVKFEHLKKNESNKSSLFINQAVKHAGIKDKFNLRDFFETPIKDISEEYSNETILLYRTLLFLFSIEITNNEKNEDVESIKKSISELKKNGENTTDTLIYEQIYDRLQKIHKGKKDILNLDILDFIKTFNIWDKSKFTEQLEKEEKFNKEGGERQKAPKDDGDAILANAYSFFEKLLEIFKKKTGRGFIPYKVKDLGIFNRKQYYTFLQNLKGKKSEIMAKKFLTYQDVLEKKIKEKVKRIFLKGKRIYPIEVKYKYAGNDEDYYQDINKLVKPSENVKFIISEEPEMKKDLIQDNDFKKNEDGNTEKIKKNFIIKKIPDTGSEGAIDIFINLKLESETIIKEDDEIDETITQPSSVSLFKIAANMVKNIQKNLDCGNAKKEFKKDADDIYDIFKNKLGSHEFKEPYVGKTNSPASEHGKKTIATIIPISKNVSFIKRQVVKGGKRRNRTLKKR